MSREIDVDNLVREDQKQREQERLEVLLLQGLDSGSPIEVTPEYWEQKKARLLEQLQKAKLR